MGSRQRKKSRMTRLIVVVLTMFMVVNTVGFRAMSIGVNGVYADDIPVAQGTPAPTAEATPTPSTEVKTEATPAPSAEVKTEATPTPTTEVKTETTTEATPEPATVPESTETTPVPTTIPDGNQAETPEADQAATASVEPTATAAADAAATATATATPSAEPTATTTPEMAVFGMTGAARAVNGPFTEVNNYADLTAALVNDNNVKLMGPIIMTAGITIGNAHNVTIDLNGQTITFDAAFADVAFTVSGGASLTVTDSTEDKDGSIDAGDADTDTNTEYLVDVQADSAFTLSGGTLKNNETTAVNVNGGTVTISGGAISNNTVDPYGGAIYAVNSNVIISGGVITENEAREGGGIFAVDTNLTMRGGEISKNKGSFNYTGGALGGSGGGIYLSGANAGYTFEGGTIQGNEAGAKGGGVYLTDGAFMNMTGGVVDGNVAQTYEGGGIYLDGGSDASITGGKVINNRTNTENHWGGGGIFCADGTTLYMEKLLVRNNTADGYGGGVAGCSTGRLFLFGTHYETTGAAIFDNTANGNVNGMSGNESTKSADWTYAHDSEVFTSNGYQDYYGAFISDVSNQMLGGGHENWSGSADGVAIPPQGTADTVLVASYVMGLTADPSPADKNKAISAANDAANPGVIVEGNYSAAHGGGILCNGYLVLSDADPLIIDKSLEIKATKAFTENGVAPAEIPSFIFQVEDGNGNVVSETTNDIYGNILFKMLSFGPRTICPTHNQTLDKCSETNWEFMYTLVEKKPDNPNIAIDGEEYTLEVEVRKEESKFTVGNKEITKIVYDISDGILDDGGITFTAAPADKSTAVLLYTGYGEQQWDPMEIGNAADEAFTNTATTLAVNDTVDISVNKEWLDNNNVDSTRPASVTVRLYADGEATNQTLILDNNNSWTGSFSNLSKYTAAGYTISYTVKEAAVDGYRSVITGDAENGFVVTNTRIPRQDDDSSDDDDDDEDDDNDNEDDDDDDDDSSSDDNSTGTPPTTGGGNTPSATSTGENKAPDTGDDSNIVVWLVLFVTSALVAFAVYFGDKRREQE